MASTGGGGGGDAAAAEPAFEEPWRQVVIDVVTPPTAFDDVASNDSICDEFDDDFLDGVGEWESVDKILDERQELVSQTC